MNHGFFEKNSIILLIGALIVVSIGGIVEIAPLFFVQSTIEKVQGMRPYSPLELAGRDIYVREGCYLLPQPDDPLAARRGRALRPLQPGRGKHVRPSLPVGIEAYRPRSCARRRQIFGRLACRAHARPALGRAGIDHAGLSVPGPDACSTTRTSPNRMKALEGAGRSLQRRDDREARKDVVSADIAGHEGGKGSLARYPKAQVRKFDGQPPGDNVPPTELDAVDRLSANARHARRLHEVRRQRSKPSIRNSALAYEDIQMVTQIASLAIFIGHHDRGVRLRLLAEATKPSSRPLRRSRFATMRPRRMDGAK